MTTKITIILLTFFLAMALTIVPMSGWTMWLRPMWIPMVLISWIMLKPQWVHIGFAFFIGLIMDILLGTILGEHALLLSLVCYLIVTLQKKIVLIPLNQKLIAVCWVLFCYQMTQLMVQASIGQLPGTWLYWLPLFSSALCWPLVHLFIEQVNPE